MIGRKVGPLLVSMVFGLVSFRTTLVGFGLLATHLSEKAAIAADACPFDCLGGFPTCGDTCALYDMQGNCIGWPCKTGACVRMTCIQGKCFGSMVNNCCVCDGPVNPNCDPPCFT